MTTHPPPSHRGAANFVLLHHSGCPRVDAGAFHYRVNAAGTIETLLAETARGQHPRSIAVLVQGDFDVATPSESQLDALRELLLELAIRYPAARLGAHRQVRGEQPTSCPGKRFPARSLVEWYRHDVPKLRDERHTRDVESQYQP